MTVDANSGYYYALKNDGNVYNIVILKNNNTVTKASSSIVYSKSAYGGNIIDFNYAGHHQLLMLEQKHNFLEWQLKIKRNVLNMLMLRVIIK